MNEITLNDKIKIGNSNPCFIIAEAGVNHNGDIVRALEMVDVAAAAGADAIKFQTFKTENIITRFAPKAQYHIDTTGSDRTQSWFDLLKSQELSEEMHTRLMERCNEKDIVFMSTPYDLESLELLSRLKVQIYKIASTDANNIQLLEKIGAKGVPVILSSGMCYLTEIEKSITCLRESGAREIVLMQCTGQYPSPAADANLLAMLNMASKLNVVPGYSDHVEGCIAAVASIAMGAKVYEKHFTLDRGLPGPDHRASLEPDELHRLIKDIREVELMMGDGKKTVTRSEIDNRKKLRKNIVANRSIKVGEKIIENSIKVVRNGGNGLSADLYREIIGRQVIVDIKEDEGILITDLDDLNK